VSSNHSGNTVVCPHCGGQSPRPKCSVPESEGLTWKLKKLILLHKCQKESFKFNCERN
jgi:hypothetical protein